MVSDTTTLPFLADGHPPANDLFRWIAVYRDGTLVIEDGRDGTPLLPFSAIDQSQLCQFLLDPNYAELRQVLVEVDAQAGEQLIFFRRTQKLLNLNTEEELGSQYCYVVGIRRLGETDPIVMITFEDGSIFFGRDPDRVV